MKRVISALLVVSSLSFLTGCDSGVAAQFGDTKISQSTVQSRISEILAERRKYDTSQMQLSAGEALNRSELRFLLISAVFEKLASENGIVITQAMKDSRRAEIYSQVGGVEKLPQALLSAQLAPSDFDLYLQSELISNALIAKAKAAGVADSDTGLALQKLVSQITQKVGVRINPQYGTWDPTSADLVAYDPAGSAVKTLNS